MACAIPLLTPRYRKKMKKRGGARNSSARKRRVAEACSEKLMVTGYLRRQSYIIIAKNYMPQGAKGELDLVGYDG